MTSHSDPLLLNIQFGCTTEYPIRSQEFLRWKYFPKKKSNNRDLRCSHVWGCPVFVMEAKLQDDQRLPNWNQRSRLGKFLGFSDEHSTSVANV